MDLYAGKLTKGDRDVMSIIDRLLCFKLPYQTKLFCDNWYTTLSVVDKIIRRNIQYIGTVQLSRIKKVFTLKKLQFEQIDYKRIKYQNEVDNTYTFINMLQWKCKKDKVVSMLFSDIRNEYNPQETVSYESFRHLIQNQPLVVRHYNDNYHGVDNVDQLMSQIRQQINRQQIQIKRRQYEDKYKRYFNNRQRNQDRQPKCKPAHVFDYFKNHHRTYVSTNGRKCSICKCRYSMQGCSCHKTHPLCKECYQVHISDLKTRNLYGLVKSRQK
ncbi:PiggyBac_transposable element-derived protein [Hexamita inflata]|uniref:PiggyBac transposable element-derived protein n=1 Tax=Hexamita inflata TaxID=28002 RepID=A0AA86UWM9_9EUKA|nr:PiggyBac transposable element-derived protein [Hexamita inflata]